MSVRTPPHVEDGSRMAQPAAPRPPGRGAGARLLSFSLLTAALVTGTLTEGTTKRASRRADGSSDQLASLRRQLMVNNYDYMPSESDEFPAREREARAAPAPSLLPVVNEVYIPRAAETPPLLESGRSEDSELHNNDLLYYMDVGALSRRADAIATLRHPHDLAADAAPKLKYKVLKMKARGGSRRSGAGAYRRFVQEEGERGVAIINLGDEPFPEFRLPSARRQYMEETARSGADLDVALPSDLDGEPLTRPPQN